MSACIMNGNAFFGFIELAIISSGIISAHLLLKYVFNWAKLKKVK